MRPAPFDLLQPQTLEEALQALAAGATPLAGGQSLLQSMRLGLSRPDKVVDVLCLDTLGAQIERHGTLIEVGAKVTHQQLADNDLLAQYCPWLCVAAKSIGDVQVRNLGTTLGNVCWADPRANMAIAMLASGAQLKVFRNAANPATESLSLDDVFVGFRQTALDGRLAHSLQVPVDSGAEGCYLEFSRQPQDLAVVSVCVVKGDHGVRIALGGVAPTPLRNRQLEEMAVSLGDVSDIAEILHQDTRCIPPADSFGSRDYKLHVAAELTLRALQSLND